MIKNNLIRGIFSTLAGATLWGFSGECGEFLTKNGMTSSYVTPLRLTAAGIILIIFAVITQKDKLSEILKNPKDLATAAFFGLLGVFPSQFFYLATIEHSNAGTATVLQYTGSALIIVYMCLHTLCKRSGDDRFFKSKHDFMHRARECGSIFGNMVFNGFFKFRLHRFFNDTCNGYFAWKNKMIRLCNQTNQSVL